jgi:hypothetical protein
MSAEASSQAAATAENPVSGKESRRKRRRETLVEVVEVLVLAIVAVATSCSGYVAARDYRTAFDAWLKTDPRTNPAMAMLALPRV